MHIIIDTYRLAPGCGSDAYGWDELDAHVEHASSHQSQALLADGHHTRHQLLWEKKKKKSYLRTLMMMMMMMMMMMILSRIITFALN